MKYSKYTVVVLDDEKNIRKSVEMVLAAEGIHTLSAHDPAQAIRTLHNHPVDLIILDIELGEIDGLSFYSSLREQGFNLPVLFISGHATPQEAAQSVKLGGFDFIEKPFDSNTLVTAVKQGLDYQDAVQSLTNADTDPDQAIIGNSTPIKQAKLQAGRVAASNASVLLAGESGTGKELMAVYIHVNSQRVNKPFVTVNCSAIPESLVESELFGHVKGAFTGAISSKKGYFELAHTGTLFLDEIADLSSSAQAKVLRVLQNGEIQKVGSEQTFIVDVRVVAGTHKDLNRLVKEGLFREDLLYRIKVVPIQLPPLRDRVSDIPLLVEYFKRQIQTQHNVHHKTFDMALITCLQDYHWPGNIRELRNLVERLLIMGPEKITLSHLPPEYRRKKEHQLNRGGSLKELRDDAERQLIIDCLKRCRGNITQAAKALELRRTYLHKRIGQLKIQKKDYFN